MKKMMTVISLSAAMLFSTGAHAQYSSDDISVASMLSAIVVASSVAVPFAILDDLSTSSRPLKIKQVETKGDRTRVKCTDGNKEVELEVNTQTAQKAQVAPGKDLNVTKQNLGYALDVNKQVIGIVPTTQDFKSTKVN